MFLFYLTLSASHYPEKELIRKINNKLPEDIRVFGALRVPKHFCGRRFCDSRSYSYLCPSFAFSSTNEVSLKCHLKSS